MDGSQEARYTPTNHPTYAFHNNMQATLQLDGETTDTIEVSDGLRQGCCMAPMLFNLHAYAFVERFLAEVEGLEGVGVTLNYKIDGRLFRHYTNNSNKKHLTEMQFADDTALLATSRSGAVVALKGYMKIAACFGSSLNVQKTKLMVTGREVAEEDIASMCVAGGHVECVTEFPYLGSVISSTGRMRPDVDQRIARASRAFGALHKAVFNNKDLKLGTKKMISEGR